MSCDTKKASSSVVLSTSKSDNETVNKMEENSNVKRRTTPTTKEHEEIMNKKSEKEEGSIKSMLGCKETSTSLCNVVDQMNYEKLQDVLQRAKKNDLEQPFSFLANISGEEAVDDYFRNKELEITDIDTRLANLVKRVELNRTLLEKTNQHIKDIDTVIEKNKLTVPKDEVYDEEVFVKMKESGTTEVEADDESLLIEFPEIEELRRTMDKTRDMLNYVKRVAKGETVDFDERPAELSHHLNLKKEEKSMQDQELNGST